MKLILSDNFASGVVSDVLVAEKVSETHAEEIAEAWNAKLAAEWPSGGPRDDI